MRGKEKKSFLSEERMRDMLAASSHLLPLSDIYPKHIKNTRQREQRNNKLGIIGPSSLTVSQTDQCVCL